MENNWFRFMKTLRKVSVNREKSKRSYIKINNSYRRNLCDFFFFNQILGLAAGL